MTIMIVDDNKRIREVMKNLLSSVCETFYEYENGTDAVQMYTTVSPDWVLMDIQMEGIDGITATRQIVEKDPKANILIVTGYDDKAFRTSAANAGAKGFFLKESIFDLVGFFRS